MNLSTAIRPRTYGNRPVGAEQVVSLPRGGGARGPWHRHLDRARRDRRPARSERGRASPRRSTCCSGCCRPTRGSVSLFGRPPAESIKLGAIGAMLQTGSLIRDLSVRELVTMMASLYPDPMPVDEVIDLTGIGDIAAPAYPEALRRADAARALRRCAGVQPRLARPRRADRGNGRRGSARVLDDDARLRQPRQDRRFRHALPRGGRRLRRPHHSDGPRSDRRRRAGHRDQGHGRRPIDSGDAARRRPRRARCAARRHEGRSPRRVNRS